MSFEINKIYRQEVPALRFIGKKYGDKDRIDGMFGKYWHDWLQNEWFDEIKKQTDKNLKTMYENGDSTIGLMRWKEGEDFEYWIGIFMPENTVVPKGYEYHDFPKSILGVCWVYGNEPDIYMKESECAKKLEEKKYKIVSDNEGAYWFFERYVPERFMADKNGKSIMDICHYIE
jgi:hypothetical protein